MAMNALTVKHLSLSPCRAQKVYLALCTVAASMLGILAAQKSYLYFSLMHATISCSVSIVCFVLLNLLPFALSFLFVYLEGYAPLLWILEFLVFAKIYCSWMLLMSFPDCGWFLQALVLLVSSANTLLLCFFILQYQYTHRRLNIAVCCRYCTACVAASLFYKLWLMPFFVESFL